MVQLYVRDEYSTTTTPAKALKGFDKIDLKSGQKRTVKFTLSPEELAIVDRDLKWTVEPGWFEVSTGGLKKRFEVVAR